MRRHGFSVVAVVAALVAGGCGSQASEPGGPAPAQAEPSGPPPPPTAQEVLVGSVPGPEQGRFLVTQVTHELTLDGVVDAASERMELRTEVVEEEVGLTFIMTVRQVAQDTWVTMSFIGAEGVPALEAVPEGWMLVDPSRADLFEQLSYQDPVGIGPVFTSIVEVNETGTGEYEGTTDLTAITTSDALVGPEVADALGPDAAAVPFAASVDGEGRLTSLTLDLPAGGDIPAHEHRVTFDYGSTPEIEPPPADAVQPVPPEVYDLLGG